MAKPGWPTVMRPIPISAARVIAKNFGYDQVVIIARKVGDGGGEHVTTWGRDKANCDVAARIGNFIKYKMGWLLNEPLNHPQPKEKAR